jgi:CDP-diacylglycerol--glycerol-3-phosphate 3-phosphatidyltransferase
MQMGFMSVVLWPILPAGALTIAGTLFAIPTALGFLRDWLVVSGRLDPDQSRYRAVQRWLVTASRVYAPPLLRLTVAGGMALVYAAAWPRIWQPETWQALFAGWGVPGAGAIALFLALLGFATTAAVTLGWLGRVAALFLLFPLGFDIVANGLAWYSGAALGADIAILLLGTGPLSLWRPEERYLFVRAGDEGFGEER